MNIERNKIYSGLKWSFLGKIFTQVITWVITLIVIRLLAPSEYGVLAMASVVLAFVALVAEFGLSASIIQKKDLNEKHLSAAFGSTIAINVFLFLVLLIIASPIASFYGEPRVAPVIRLAALQFIINSTCVVPVSIARRELRFRFLAIVDGASHVFSSVITLILALLDQGVWALVIGNLAGGIVTTFWFNITMKKKISARFSFKETRTLFDFGWRITVARLLWFIWSQADVAIAGHFLGKDAVGYYSVSMHLATLPMQKLMLVINQVAFPIIAQLQDDKDRLGRALGEALRLLGFVAIPVMWGLSAITPEFVVLILGQQWEPAVFTLQILSLVVPVRLVIAILSTATAAVGKIDVDLVNAVIAAIVMPSGFLVAVHWGINGLSFIWLIGMPFLFVLTYLRARHSLGITAGILFSSMYPSLFSGIAMMLTITAARSLLSPVVNLWLICGTLIVIGATVYLCMITILDRKIWQDFKDVLQAKL